MGLFNLKQAVTEDLCEYVEYYDEYPVLLSCNLAVANILPSKKFRYCLKVQMDVNMTNYGYGFLGDAELQHINDMENMIIEMVDGIYAGHGIVCAKEYMFIMFYVTEKDAQKYLELIRTTFSAAFRNVQAEVVYDPLGNEYKKFLFPDKYQIKEIDNKRVLKTLKKNHDDGSKPRDITYKLAFSGKDAVLVCASEAFKNGFEFKDMIKGTSNGLPQFILILKTNEPFETEEINKKTRYLMDLARSHTGTYKGLETEIKL